MAEWKCTQCGAVKDGRCKPKKCSQCGGQDTFQKKE
ncbi:MAG: rubredoxin [Candidatus Zixiibacteriota bacterium]|nr:MAG: rubredoxin [candidate division Zixibacteria bacterium]